MKFGKWAWVFAVLVLAPAPAFGQKAGPRVTIQVTGEWGDSAPADVKKVCESAAEQLLVYCPDRKLDPIVLKYRDDVPMTLYARTKAGEYQVLLGSKDRRWSQLAYQFAHELGHILMNYDRHRDSPHQWFNEALCETASLFTLRKMAEGWKTNPPYANWKSYSDSLTNYANVMLADRKRRLSPDLTMSMWLKKEMPQLRKERGLSERSFLAANYLLPLFEETPEGWESLTWFNLGEKDSELDFADFLAAWHQRVPQKHKKFVGQVQTLFGYTSE
jgi:hypothetical protein